MNAEQRAVADLRKECPHGDTGKYVEWLEALVLRMRAHHGALIAAVMALEEVERA